MLAGKGIPIFVKTKQNAGMEERRRWETGMDKKEHAVF